MIVTDPDPTAETTRVRRDVPWQDLHLHRIHFRDLLCSSVAHGKAAETYSCANPSQCLPSIFFAPLSTSNLPTEDGTQPRGKGNTNGDWISFLLALSISHLPTGVVDIDVAVWSRAISLLLTGLLILSSLAQVLRSLSRILRLTSKTVGAGFLLLSLGQLFVRIRPNVSTPSDTIVPGDIRDLPPGSAEDVPSFYSFNGYRPLLAFLREHHYGQRIRQSDEARRKQ